MSSPGTIPRYSPDNRPDTLEGGDGPQGGEKGAELMRVAVCGR
jgi:hypothetical protein